MSTVNYSEFWDTGAWSGNHLEGPAYYRDYFEIASNISDLDKNNPIITFTNLPANLKVVALNVGDYNPPFDTVYIDIGYADYIYLKNNSGQWVDSSQGFMAAYIPSLQIWGLGITQGSPGVIYTGSGNSGSSILDIQWQEIDEADTGGSVPSPFNHEFGNPAGPWVGTYPQEPMINYTVINNNTIQVTSDIDAIPSGLRKLYVNFSGISP